LFFIGSVAGILGIIVAFVVKADISPGAPELCLEVPPSPDGHPAIQTHEVVTEDGITLQLWRVPAAVPSKPVLVMHGLQCSSREWFVGLDTDSLPWFLWREGFDVWVGNNRGNFFTTTPTWDWTYVEMGDYDVPAMVNFIVAETEAPAIGYIGHSQGATQAFIHFAENANTASKIAYFAGLAPAVFMTQRVLMWNVFAQFHIDDIVSLATAQPGTAFLTYEEMQRDKCWSVSFTDGLCTSMCGGDMGGTYMHSTSGWAPKCLDKFRCIPAGSSSDNIRAFADSLRDGGFQAYLTNLGRPINFTNLNMKIGLAAGTMDQFMTPEDVQQIQSECRPGIVEDFWEVEGAGHMDLMWGTALPQTVFVPLAEKLHAHLG
jgi:pimeloyl-ACP methyl ester carboxylesterase